MPLLDHFHSPLGQLPWSSFHSGWANAIASSLTPYLPSDFVAWPNARFGIEIDVGTYGPDRDDEPPTTLCETTASYTVTPQASRHNGSSSNDKAASFQEWKPDAPTHLLPFGLTQDIVEVQVMYSFGGLKLVGAIELVSPGNKDRPAQRSAFVAKCEAYLREGVGLVIVDIVTARHANLHNDLMARFSAATPPLKSHLYATAYHPHLLDDATHLSVWTETLAVDEPLPTLPLGLGNALFVPVALESTYDNTCMLHKLRMLKERLESS